MEKVRLTSDLLRHRPAHRRPALAPVILTLLSVTLLILPAPLSLSWRVHLDGRVTAPLVSGFAPISPQPGVTTLGNGVNKTVSQIVAKWSDVTSMLTSLPNKRYGSGLAYDPLLGESVLFGGYNDSVGFLNDTWVLKNSQWTKVTTPVAPSPRYLDLPMVYDPEEQGVVLFGGLTGIFAYSVNDTWLFDGTKWTNLSLKHAPSAAAEAEIAWDPALAGVLCVVPTTPTQTWLFKSGSWTNLSPPTEPDPLQTASMEYDARDGYMLLFGGWNSSQVWTNEMWTFANGTWSQLTGITAPAGRLDAKLVFDNQTRLLMLFGGLTANGGSQYIFNDTWAFSGGAWTELYPATAPPPVWLASATFDASAGEILLVNGQTASGVTLNQDWYLNVTVATLNASISSSVGGVPLHLWLNSTISGGLPPYTTKWNVNNGFSSTGANAVFILRSTGNFTVTVTASDLGGTPLLLSFRVETFLPTYTVSFTEAGLPTSTSWSATLNGTTRYSTGSQIGFSMPNGTYVYSIGSILGYRVNSSGGSLSVVGSSRSVAITFVEVGVTTFSVTFSESGLAAGTNWSVRFNGVTEFSTTSEILYSSPNGSYSYSVGLVSGYTVHTAAGIVDVAGAPKVVTVQFTQRVAPAFSVTFLETGLTNGTNWSVTFNGTLHFSQSSTLTLIAVNGSYPYSVGPLPGYNCTPTSGVVHLDGFNQTLALLFSGLGNASSPTGLPIVEPLLLGLVVAALVVATATVLVLRRRRAAYRTPGSERQEGSEGDLAEGPEGPSDPPQD